jgi:hypothetical protein
MNTEYTLCRVASVQSPCCLQGWGIDCPTNSVTMYQHCFLSLDCAYGCEVQVVVSLAGNITFSDHVSLTCPVGANFVDGYAGLYGSGSYVPCRSAWVVGGALNTPFWVILVMKPEVVSWAEQGRCCGLVCCHNSRGHLSFDSTVAPS